MAKSKTSLGKCHMALENMWVIFKNRLILISNIMLLLLLLLLSRSSRVRLCATPETAAHQAPRPWDSPGKNTGVGCHFLLQCMKGKSEREVAQSCLTLATPWTAAFQAPPSMGFSRQEYRSGVILVSIITLIWLCCTACRILVPQPGESGPSAVKT